MKDGLLSRVLELPKLLDKKSFFLFGPRATGKSSLIRAQLSQETLVINLLRSDLYLRLTDEPSALEAIIKSHTHYGWVVIDEIQRVPLLLNEVHRLIEEQNMRFLLTGSSARTLKRASVNLLAGRAWTAELFPLIAHEIPDFDLERYLLFGGLPPVYLSMYPEEELDAYVSTYLKEEIQAESLVRKIPAFSRFLKTSALTSGQILNFTQIASDAGVPVTTVREYYCILEDTFIGFMLPAWTKSVKRKAMSTAKFYYFDIGVRNALLGIKSLERQTNLYGQVFEHFIILEIRAYLSYRRYKLPLHYWRSKHGAEVDLIIGDTTALEIKASHKVMEKHLKGLRVLAEEGICKHYFLVSQDPVNRKYDDCELFYWKDFLMRLWQGEIAFN